jgi:hypothetical protein
MKSSKYNNIVWRLQALVLEAGGKVLEKLPDSGVVTVSMRKGHTLLGSSDGLLKELKAAAPKVEFIWKK